MDRDKELRLSLTPKQWDQLKEILDDYGLKTYADMIRLMIKEKYDQLLIEQKAVDLSLKKEN